MTTQHATPTPAASTLLFQAKTVREARALLTGSGMTKVRGKLTWTHKGEGVTVNLEPLEDGSFAAYGF